MSRARKAPTSLRPCEGMCVAALPSQSLLPGAPEACCYGTSQVQTIAGDRAKSSWPMGLPALSHRPRPAIAVKKQPGETPTSNSGSQAMHMIKKFDENRAKEFRRDGIFKANKNKNKQTKRLIYCHAGMSNLSILLRTSDLSKFVL